MSSQEKDLTVGGTSLRISRGRKALADALAVEVSSVLGKPIRPSTILNFALDKFLSPQVADMFIKDFYEKNPELNPENGEKKR